MSTTAQAHERSLTIDALQYNKPERARFEEWRQGKIDCVHVTVAIWENARETLTTLGQWNRLLEDNTDLIALATSAQEIEAIAASNRIAIIFGFQDTSPFEDDIELVEIFHRLGIRIVQLTYNVQNRVAAGCWEPDEAGLSKFYGKNIVREMNKLGMLIDVSHCTERTCFDAIEFSSRPIAITHANPAEFVGSDIELNRRNKSSPLLKSLAARGGVLGLSMYPKIMRDGSDCKLNLFLDMVAFTVDLMGIDAVGIGTDYYDGWPESAIKWWRAGRFARESAVPIKGFSRWPDWFKSSADFPNIGEGLRQRGFADEDMAKIMGGNWLRLFRDSFLPEKRLAAGPSLTAASGRIAAE